MTANEWLIESTNVLKQVGIATARLDCIVLLEDATEKDRAYLLAHPELVLTATIHRKLKQQIQRRVNHEPLAYIRGKSEFYGREFLVSSDTLQPRSETETMIDLLKAILQNKNNIPKVRSYKLVDVGTGSGALAITAKLEIPDLVVYGTDISINAINVAISNAKTLKADVNFYQGDLLEPISSSRLSHYALLCNLPYIPDDQTINQAAMHEPKIAIFGGSDGLDIYREMFEQITAWSHFPEYILTESLPSQHKELINIAKSHGYTQNLENDYIQVFTPRHI